MSYAGPAEAGARPGLRGGIARVAGRTLTAFEQVGGALVTAVMAFVVLVWLLLAAVTSLVGLGRLTLPAALRGVYSVGQREGARLSAGTAPLVRPVLPPPGWSSLRRDPDVGRGLRWLIGHATLGLLLGTVALLLPISALRDLTLPLWWRLFPRGAITPTLSLWTVYSGRGALAAMLLGAGWAVLSVAVTPPIARYLSHRGWALLPATASTDLTLRIAQLSATRAAALDSHATELRRIERALHDGTQNRLVAVTILLGAAQRAVERDSASVGDLLARAHSAAEDALLELRSVARSIMPAVLSDRGLDGALRGLVAASAVPCVLEIDVPARCPAAVEASAYFVVAESLTNASRHSNATKLAVHVRQADGGLHVTVNDDGTGGAEESRGTGLTGIRQRVEALDGDLSLTSPAGGPTTIEVRLPCGS